LWFFSFECGFVIVFSLGKLMVDIDYRVFVAHGTGWGALIASQLAVLNPLSCLVMLECFGWWRIR